MGVSACLLAALIIIAPLVLFYWFRGRDRRWGWALVGVFLAIPLLVADALPMVRFVLGIGALVSVAKAIECSRGRASDPSMQRTLGRFLFWYAIPSDSSWPTTVDAAATARRHGRRRLLRALAKLPVVAGLVILNARVPRIGTDPWLSVFWVLWFTYFWVSAALDVVTGLAMQTGIHVAEVFDTPPLARSPADFWSRRWNLFFCRWARRNLFLPLGGRRHPARALVAVFVISALAHEYLVLLSLGTTSGHMTAFFLLQGLATLASMKIARRRRGRALFPPVFAVPLHVAWLTLTAPLFFHPVIRIFCASVPHG
jgi:hypothetical protein